MGNATPAGNRSMQADQPERPGASGTGGTASPWVVPTVKWASLAAAAVGLLLIMGALPVQQALAGMQSWLHGVGWFWAALIYALGYAVAVVFFVPGAPLTIAAGVIFGGFWSGYPGLGLALGTVTVVLGSNTGAATAFLIARYGARDRVAAMAKHSGKFGAVDHAIQQGGWKIVAMLRLSPAVPFNLQNYLYGLTGIRFWACVLTSIVAMLPGTFLYVYIGYLGRAAAASASGGGGGGGVQWGKWTLLGLGLLATVAVTVYITRQANRALKERPELESGGEATETASDTEGAAMHDETQTTSSPAPAWRGAILTASVAVVMLALGCTAQAYKSTIQGSLLGLFGPPSVTMQEAYEPKPDGPGFDHSLWNRIVSKHVGAAGFVDYAAIKHNPQPLNQYIEKLADAPFDEMGRNQKLALLINAYNAFTVKLILEHWNGGQLESIKDIPAEKRWEAKRWQIGSHTWSLNQIEHEQVRPKFKEPRVHFALVCAAYSCPPLRTEAYTADRIDQQLADQAEYVHNHDRWYRYEAQTNTVHLTALYDWYGSDFKQTAGSVLQFVAQYAPKVKQAMSGGEKPSVEYIDYSWKLNDKANKSMLDKP